MILVKFFKEIVDIWMFIKVKFDTESVFFSRRQLGILKKKTAHKDENILAKTIFCCE